MSCVARATKWLWGAASWQESDIERVEEVADVSERLAASEKYEKSATAFQAPRITKEKN